MKAIQDIFDEAVADGVFPGCCACVIDQNHTYLVVAGNRALYPEIEKNELSTQYDLASLSKVIVTTMVTLRMVNRQELDLDIPVISYLKDCPWKDMTLRQILTHTSGLQADLEVSLQDDKQAIKQHIYAAKRNTIGQVVYSDCGYIILQFVLEEVSGKPLDQLAQEEVFTPLHMKQTMYCPPKKLWQQCAPTEYSEQLGYMIRGEVHDEKAYQLQGIAGHAGVFSTITDMEIYARMFLDKDNSYLPYELKKECFHMQYPQMEVPRGLGYICANADISQEISDEVAYHTGFCGNSILLDMKQQLAIIVLSNRVHPSRQNEKILPWRRTMHDRIIRELRSIG